MAGGFIIPPWTTDKTTRQKTSKDIEELDYTTNQQDLLDIYRTLHLKPAEYTFFSIAHGTYAKIDRIMGHNTNLNKFNRTEII